MRSIKGSAEFRECDVGGAWITRKIEPGAMFVTHSKTTYEVRWTSPAGQEIEVIQIHLAVDVFRAALSAGQRCGAAGSGKGIDHSPGFE